GLAGIAVARTRTGGSRVGDTGTTQRTIPAPAPASAATARNGAQQGNSPERARNSGDTSHLASSNAFVFFRRSHIHRRTTDGPHPIEIFAMKWVTKDALRSHLGLRS